MAKTPVPSENLNTLMIPTANPLGSFLFLKNTLAIANSKPHTTKQTHITLCYPTATDPILVLITWKGMNV